MPPAAEGPRLLRAVALQLCALLSLALASEWPRARAAPVEPPRIAEPAKKPEQRLRVVKLPPPERRRTPTATAAATRTATPPPTPPPSPPANPTPPAPATPPATPTPTATRAPPPPTRTPTITPPATTPRTATPTPSKPRVLLNATAVHGVQLRILVPSSAGELAAHLRNSGGCMVVSRLSGGEAEVVSVLALDSGRAVEQPGPPCAGVPRLLREPRLNDALGDPLGRARAQGAAGELVLQVLLTPQLQDSARLALRARFGAGSEEEIARLAADAGYQLTCFAEPAGPVRCQ